MTCCLINGQNDISNQQAKKEIMKMNNKNNIIALSSKDQIVNTSNIHHESWSDENFVECVSLWDLSNVEQDQLRMLKEKIVDIEHWKNNPFDVVRFLVEYKGDIDVAETKFRAMIHWRITNDVDNILNNYTPPRLFNYFPVGVMEGVDRDGDPILVERTGAGDSLGLFEKFGKEEMIRHAIWVREVGTRGLWQNAYRNEHGHRVKQFTIIMDLQDLNRRHLSPSLTPVGKEVTRIIQDNYPGLTKRIIFIRAPMFFRMAWYLFQPLIDQYTTDKIIFSTWKDYEEVLSKCINPEVLPNVILPRNGKGEAVNGFTPCWEGGLLPEDNEDEEDDDFPHPNNNIVYSKEFIKVAQ